ncbi:MAG: rhomboid family intramembrane serine protease [Acidimicrobiales bacterium]
MDERQWAASSGRPKLSDGFSARPPRSLDAGRHVGQRDRRRGLDGRLDRFGIRPRRFDGLDGIVFSPFLHDGLGHLIANSVPFLLLGAVIALGSARRFLLVTAIIAVVAGVGTWLTGPDNSVHIGASGLVFGYVTYLVSRGVFARNLAYLAGGVVVLMVYGGVLWGLLPRPGISWQGHLFGALGGVLAARAVHPPAQGRPEQPTFGEL